MLENLAVLFEGLVWVVIILPLVVSLLFGLLKLIEYLWFS